MELFYVQLIFLVISGVFVLIRAYVKIFMVKKVTLDDHLIFLAMVSPKQISIHQANTYMPRNRSSYTRHMALLPSTGSSTAPRGRG